MIHGLFLCLAQIFPSQDAPVAPVAVDQPPVVAPAPQPAPAVVEVTPIPVVSPWKHQLVASANLATSFFHDWAQGGEDNFAWSLKLNGNIERDVTDWNWNILGRVEFGQIQVGDASPRKSADEFKLETILVRKLNDMLNPFASAAIRSQFATGYKYPKTAGPRQDVSAFLDPAYFTQTLGVGYKPNEIFQTRLGAAVQETRTDSYNSYSDDTTTTKIELWKVEPGAEWTSNLKATLFQSLVLESQLGLFVNFKGVDEVDVAWTNLVAWQFTKYVNVNFSGELRRDIQQVDAWQWKHVLSLGLTANLL